MQLVDRRTRRPAMAEHAALGLHPHALERTRRDVVEPARTADATRSRLKCKVELATARLHGDAARCCRARRGSGEYRRAELCPGSLRQGCRRRPPLFAGMTDPVHPAAGVVVHAARGVTLSISVTVSDDGALAGHRTDATVSRASPPSR